MKAIVAVDKNWGIGNNGELLCRISEDMRHFRSITFGKTVVMGRKTFESLPGKKPLMNRENIIVSRNKNFSVRNATVVSSIQEVVNMDSENLIVIGGQNIYEQLLPYCDTVYLTMIDKEFEADAYFPNLFVLPNWKIVEKSEIITENDISFQFLTLKKN